MLETVLALGLLQKGFSVVKRLVGLVIIGVVLILGYAHFTNQSPEPLLKSYGVFLQKSGHYAYIMGRKGIVVVKSVITSPEVKSGAKWLVDAGKDAVSKY